MPRTSKRPLYLAVLSRSTVLAGTLCACTGPSSDDRTPPRGAEIEAPRPANLDSPSADGIQAPPAGEAPKETQAPAPPNAEAPSQNSVAAPPQEDPEIPGSAPSQQGDPSRADDEETPEVKLSIPSSILPAGCTPGHEEEGPWDGKERFMLGCHRPRLPDWKPAGKTVDYGTGSAFIAYIYRKDGWMLLRSEICCSSCEPDQLTDCEPHLAARLYPPSDLKECEKSQICAKEGLCLQEQGWCRAPDEA